MTLDTVKKKNKDKLVQISQSFNSPYAFFVCFPRLHLVFQKYDNNENSEYVPQPHPPLWASLSPTS